MGRGLGTPVVPNTCSHNGHLYYVLLPNFEQRTELIVRMKADDSFQLRLCAERWSA
jgi:hypothetical protein